VDDGLICSVNVNPNLLLCWMNSSASRPQGRIRRKPSRLSLSFGHVPALICSDNRHRKSEKEEDEELLNESKEDEEEPYVFEESAPCTSPSHNRNASSDR
jgi:hypothetical protein